MLKVLRSNLDAFYKKIADNMSLYLPVVKGGEVNFGYYTDGATVDIDTLKTVKSPKDVFFPQSETMMKFKTEGKTLTIEDVRKKMQPYVVFGVRACDYKAFTVLDNVFLQQPVDTFYQLRREAAIICTLACGKPQDSCFCNTFGIDQTNPGGDITCWTDETALYLTANTDKGNKLLELVAELTEPCDDAVVKAICEQSKTIAKTLPFANLDLSRFKPENLNELFNLPVWDELSSACLGCGACTFVCPTCQCFDIRDFNTNKDIIRFRCWDSCMYSDFTQMAAANPRTTQMQRYRQRFMHKLVYYPSQYGMYSCVGCGRCVKKCPQHLNIVKVIKKIGGQKHD